MEGDDGIDEVVAEAEQLDAKDKEHKMMIEERKLEFRPLNYQKGHICQIIGNFTEWIPVNMQMHPVDEQQDDPEKAGIFFITVYLIKGFRYKYRFIYKG